MSWESPIDISYQTVYKDIGQQIDNYVMEAITEVGVSVNKEELIKCINYDRNSYEKGYEDGCVKAIDIFLKYIEKHIAYSYDHLTYSKIADMAERFKRNWRKDNNE